MKRAGKSLLSLSLSSKLVSLTKPSTPIRPFPLLRPLSTTTTTTTTTTSSQENNKASNSKAKRDSIILEKFKQRQLKASPKTPQTTSPPQPQPPSGDGLQDDKKGPAEVLSSFQGLGLREEVIGAVEEMDIWVPSEIQCVGIPAVLDGKSVVLSSDSASGRTLAYLLPVVQLLRRDEASFGLKPNHPRAIVLCTTEEQSDEGFRMAKFISDCARLKSAKESGSGQSKPQEELSNASIGMLVGTPSEVIQYMEEGSVFLDDIKYLVLDEADAMLDNGLGPEIQKIINPLKNGASETNKQGFQTVLVTSTVTKMLGKQLSPLMERLERDNAGKVAAMLLEMDQTEVFDLIESPNALKKKVAEAMNSLHTDASGS